MSRYLSSKYQGLEPYVPGEQPKMAQLIKLNTNESPWPPAPGIAEAVRKEAEKLNLYSDPECTELRHVLADSLGLKPEELLITNGSDEILNFAFMAFCDQAHPAAFADITYGFYPVYAELYQIPCRIIPLREDFTLAPEDYRNLGGPAFIANPNAPTGLALKREKIREILESNPDQVIVVDEAYVDFGGESCIPLIREYGNLLVTRTFSKSRSLAGLRLGFGAGQESLIRDLKAMQYSTNPYNVDRLAQAAGVACMAEDAYNQELVREVIRTREWTADTLKSMGFSVTDSRANFLFVRHPDLPGDTLYRELRERSILVRHFSKERIQDWNRITVGSPEQMRKLTDSIQEILEARKA